MNRIIPAHAGNSRASGAQFRGRTDHPRACGELRSTSAVPRSLHGSSPRMRGTLANIQTHPISARIIPAHAGNSLAQTPPPTRSTDHPRACGELHPGKKDCILIDGSSPRMRGTPPKNLVVCDASRIIPAHAGNSISALRAIALLADHPRACGELTMVTWVKDRQGGSSPRMRGTPVHRSRPAPHFRIIPAHAGNSLFSH